MGVKAGLLVGLLTTAGVLQVFPPSVEVAITTWLTAPPVNRASSNTTYRFPLLASLAAEGKPAPVRRSAPVLGAKSFTVCWVETTVGFDHVSPPSEDETKPTLRPLGVNFGEPVVWNSSKKS